MYASLDWQISVLGPSRDPDRTIAGRVSSLERNIAANNIANAALLASSLESSLSLSNVPQPDSLGEKADLETHEKDKDACASPAPNEDSPSSSGSDRIHSNPNDIVNLTTMHNSLTHSNNMNTSPSPFYLNQGPGSQSSNNLSLDSNIGLNLSAVFPSNLSNSNPNLNSSSRFTTNSSADHTYSSAYQINRINNGSVLMGSSTPSPPSPVTPTYAIKSANNCAHLQVCTRFKRLIGLPGKSTGFLCIPYSLLRDALLMLPYLLH